MTLPPNWLEEARAKCAAATPGEWFVETRPVSMGHRTVGWSSFVRMPGDRGHGPQFCDVADTETSETVPPADPNAAFIAFARTALPTAIDEIARLQGVVADAVRLLFNASPTCGSMFTPGARWQEQRDAFIAEHRAAFDAVYGPEAQHGGE